MNKNFFTSYIGAVLFFLSLTTLSFGSTYDFNNFGAEQNPTGNPIGGGDGYTEIIDEYYAYFYVNNKEEFLTALRHAINGDIIYIDDNAEIDLAGENNILINAGITIASGRGRNGSVGALLYFSEIIHLNETQKPYSLFIISGANVRITGLRLDGPIPYKERDKGYWCDGIISEYPNLTVDNCELSGWSHAAIYLKTGAYNSKINYNYFHHNQRSGGGYGVCLNESNALIKANIFDWGRHAIAATGRPGTSYEACYNIVKENFYEYPFDMHGGGDRKDGTNIAGDWIKIHHNSFYTKDAHYGAIHISGTPRYGCFIFNNWFIHATSADCISQREYSTDYNSLNPPNSIPIIDPRRTSNFKNIMSFQNKYTEKNWGSNQTVPNDRYRAADFTGDGKVDIIHFANNGIIGVKKAAGLGFEAMMPWGYNGVDIGPDRYKIGDFDGNGKMDIISFENNYRFYVWLSSTGAFNGPLLWVSYD